MEIRHNVKVCAYVEAVNRQQKVD